MPVSTTTTPREPQRINKTQAMRRYGLEPEQLDGLDYKALPNPLHSQRPIRLYAEREVQKRAWEVHGGKEGHKEFMNKKRALYLARQAAKYSKGQIPPKSPSSTPAQPRPIQPRLKNLWEIKKEEE